MSETRPDDFTDRATREMNYLTIYADDLPRLIAASVGLQAASSPSELLSQIVSKTGIALKEVRTVFSALDNLRLLQTQLGSADEALSAVRAQIDTTVAELVDQKRSQIISAIESYDADNPLQISYKAQRLTYARERLFQNAEIYTDARPVFSSAGDKVQEFIVTHELAISWSSLSGEMETRYLSLDNADLLILRKACEKALVKAGTLKTTLSNVCHTEIVRDETNKA